MPTKDPRIKARDLLREALELREDAVLLEIARERARTFDDAAALTHDVVFGRATRRGP